MDETVFIFVLFVLGGQRLIVPFVVFPDQRVKMLNHDNLVLTCDGAIIIGKSAKSEVPLLV
jgi:hypothetical protein